MGRLHAVVDRETARRRVESGHVVGAITHDRNTLRFQVFKCPPDIEHGLYARAHDGDIGSGEFVEIRGNIHRLGSTPVHTANAPRRENPDAGHGCNDHRCSDRGRAVFAATDDECDVSAAGLGHRLTLFADVADLVGAESDLQSSVENRDSRGNGAGFSNRALDTKCGLDVLRPWHAVADDRRFECDDGIAAS